MVKNPPANAGDARDAGAISGSGRAFGEGNGNLLQYSFWKIPWAEEKGEDASSVEMVEGKRKERKGEMRGKRKRKNERR